MTHISKLLKQSRKKAKMTQGELSEKLGFTSAQYISNVERGLSGISPKYFESLEQLLKVKKQKWIKAHLDDYKGKIGV